jgi:hypothetical protein
VPASLWPVAASALTVVNSTPFEQSAGIDYAQ